VPRGMAGELEYNHISPLQQIPLGAGCCSFRNMQYVTGYAATRKTWELSPYGAQLNSIDVCPRLEITWTLACPSVQLFRIAALAAQKPPGPVTEVQVPASFSTAAAASRSRARRQRRQTRDFNFGPNAMHRDCDAKSNIREIAETPATGR
jgi:hypothetical protein